MVSDIFPSYDSDQLPGSKWPKSITLDSPAIPSVQTLIDNAKMNTLEGIGTAVFIGESTTDDNSCTPKPGDFKTIRGLCVEEPTKQGSFYLAGLAHYARTTSLSTINPSLIAFKGQNPSKDAQLKITTYALATASPLPSIVIPVGTNKVTIVPSFRDGCPKIFNPGNPYRACNSIGQDGDGSRGEIVDFQICQDDPNFVDADWPAGSPLPGGNFQYCYDVMWDDAEYGHDFDLDLRYRIYIKSDSTSITIKTRGVYASAGHLDFAGYIIKGVGLTNDGEYLDIACGNGSAAGSTDCDPWNKITTADSATPTVNDFVQRTFFPVPDPSQILNDPLWYASKYGGFNDINNNGVPDIENEWDKDRSGDPDTYFFAANPLKMEQTLTAALFDILSRASSGTSVSVLATTSAGEGAVYQAYFFPSVYDSNNEVSWLGFLQGLFFDSNGQLREDSNQDGVLVTTGPNADKVIETFFDSQNQETRVHRYDVDANGIKTGSPTDVKLTDLKPIWEAGKVLAKRKLASNPRTILTWVDKNNDGKVQAAGEYIDFSVINETTLRPYLRAASAAEGTNIINFIHGTDFTGSRIRKVTVEGEPDPTEWRLGDIVYSSPVAVGAPQERYDLKFKDSSYNDFFRKYKSRREVVYVGGNDGMLHAFNSGFFHPGDDSTTTDVEHGWFTTAGPLGTEKNRVLGEEIWGFIPQELLPHLKWLTQPAYDKSKHIYFVDGSSRITDAQIFTAEAQCATNINDVNCEHPGGWGTVLIGSMRMGGSVIKADLNGNGNTTDAGEDRFRSAYFALDITNPEKNPVLLWVYKESDLGFTTTWPAVLRFDSTHWYILFGSGPITYNGERDNLLATNKFESTVSNYGQIYVVDLKDGTLVKKMVADATEPYSFMGDPVAYDFPLNYATDVAYIGKATYLKPTAKWAGKIFRLLMQDPSTSLPTSDSTKWTLSVLFNPQKPVLVKPTATFDKSNNLWIYFGTGRYFSVGANSDQTDVSLQAYYGIKDSGTNGCWTGSGWKPTCSTSLSNSNLFNATSTAVSDTGSLTGCSCGAGATTFSNLIKNVINSASNEGWVVDLAAGERILQESTVLGGIVAITSYTPNSLDICVSQGSNKLYAMYFETGTAYSASVIGVTSGTVDRVKDLGLGLPSKINMVVSKTTVTGFVQSSTGEIIQIKGITLPFKVQTGPRSFRERTN
jgi:type IV pilus assembly protein PilY1